MLTIYKSAEDGALRELSLKTLERGSWIDIVDPSAYELKVVSNLTEVEPSSLLMMRSAPIPMWKTTQSWF